MRHPAVMCVRGAAGDGSWYREASYSLIKVSVYSSLLSCETDEESVSGISSGTSLWISSVFLSVTAVIVLVCEETVIFWRTFY